MAGMSLASSWRSWSSAARRTGRLSARNRIKSASSAALDPSLLVPSSSSGDCRGVAAALGAGAGRAREAGGRGDAVGAPCANASSGAREKSAPHATLVHIGNGRVSDLCGALAADVVFAKDSLATELERRAIPFEPFATLLDVIPGLERLLAA